MRAEICEEGVYAIQDFGGGLGVMDGVAEFGAVANAVSEEAGELFHFANGVGHFGCDEAAEISCEKMIAVEFGGLVVALRRNVLFDLAEDPWVG